MRPRYSRALIHQTQQLAQRGSADALQSLKRMGVKPWTKPVDAGALEQLVRRLSQPRAWAKDVLNQTDGHRILSGLIKGGCYKQPMRTLSQDLHLNYLLKQAATNPTTPPPPAQPQQTAPTPPKPPEPIKPLHTYFNKRLEQKKGPAFWGGQTTTPNKG